MASKRPATTTGEMKPKRPRENLLLETTIEIVKHYNGDEGANSIARILQPPQSTVSTIIEQGDSVKKVGETASTLMAKTLTRQREPIMEEMERLIRLWFDYLSHRSNSLITSLVTTKALSIYNDLHKKGYEFKDELTFIASKG
ncbi:putative CENPB DNA-binding domain-containing protein 1 [Oratosquilla oratoria]|uniref:putative CENPB DNA-binding domain-containing protein 1 n=1 Tax=Oratosquilla oratoria TaxID=337810 RepID=UPI003F77596C